MKNCIFMIPLLLLLVCCTDNQHKESRTAAEALIKRVLPEHAGHFRVEIIEPDNGKDVFEIESKGPEVVLRGNTPVEVASALNWYLRYYANSQISWNGDNINLPADGLPGVPEKVRRTSPYKYRACFNYCTFSYTMPWWDWQRWQREIDWMAMHGINMPLAITGQEAVWQNTLRNFNMNDEEIRSFLVGPAYFAWQFMTNIEGWRGPLPQSWIDSHITLGQQILERERNLGMKAILQGFTGYIPRLLQEKYPDANIACQGDWFGVPPGPGQLDPLDPLFEQMGTTFLREQEKLFGTDHLYAADPFHEGKPPVEGDQYLQDVGRIIYETMYAVDTTATVVMQTWSLREPIVRAIPEKKIILLDLAGGGNKNQYWERAWIAGVLHNYGGRNFLGGDLPYYATNAPGLMADPSRAGNLQGIGIFTEATNQNPVVYDAASEIAWMSQAPDLTRWLHDYQVSRYGQPDEHVQAAWKVLQSTVYDQRLRQPSMESAICARPVLEFKKVAPNGSIVRDYDQNELWKAWDELLKADAAIQSKTTYQYDLVDVARQCLMDLSLPLQKKFAEAYEQKNTVAFDSAASRFIELMDDADLLLGTREEFLLGKWLEDAKSWGTTEQEKRLYEANARNLITAWGPVTPQAVQYDYSNRQWSGLIKGYYKPRWEMFFSFLKDQGKDASRYSEKGLKWNHGRPAHYANDFYSKLSEWEKEWIEKTEPYPNKPQGDPVDIAGKLYEKWSKELVGN